ncbi:MAG: cytochrome C oxidase subunit I [Acidobacteria bacterium]|nr:MAG: cytochrome C oxidase subunit I [Acidobacteriota bacterium]REK07750.1 MAG: cytochrome C oxidase subunit I [Acidobacteriota bacterium]
MSVASPVLGAFAADRDALDLLASRRLASCNFAVAIAAFGLGALMAVMQALARADLPVWFSSPAVYYLSVTAHGVLMALVFTTFFIMGLGYLLMRRAFGGLEWETLGWVSFWTAVFGTVMTTLAILSGTSTVLYTFYPPLEAHPTFYIGATLLVVGSWLWCAVMIRTWLVWRRTHQEPMPLAAHGILTTVVIWVLATSGLAAEVLGQLIPWSLGWVETIDPIVARTWFWWFGHPLTYFWLVPAYVVWYTILPRVAGGLLFSDKLGRVVFVMFILFSTPVGFHHQFVDPGVHAGWKLVHTFTTYAILYPSLVTAFTIIASLEVAGRMRGGKGLFGWLRTLPWRDPLFSGVALAMLTFAIGGFGGAINAAYAMNTVVHNTAWIQGHFHLTVGTAVTLTFMGATYWFLPKLTGRRLALRPLATWQPYVWFGGMMLFSLTSHATGLMGQPRRVFSSSYFGDEVAGSWRLLTGMSAAGGVVLFVSSLMFLAVVVATWRWGRPVTEAAELEIEFAAALDPLPERRPVWDRIGLWALIAVVLVIAAYAKPIYDLLSLERYGSLPFRPF